MYVVGGQQVTNDNGGVLYCETGMLNANAWQLVCENDWVFEGVWAFAVAQQVYRRCECE